MPCSGAVLIEAVGIWAEADERATQPHDKALDIDVILAATATLLAVEGYDVVIATGNVAHLSRYAPGEVWDQIIARRLNDRPVVLGFEAIVSTFPRRYEPASWP